MPCLIEGLGIEPSPCYSPFDLTHEVAGDAKHLPDCDIGSHRVSDAAHLFRRQPRLAMALSSIACSMPDAIRLISGSRVVA